MRPMTRNIIRLTTGLALLLAATVLLSDINHDSPRNVLILRDRDHLTLLDMSRGLRWPIQPDMSQPSMSWTGALLLYSSFTEAESPRDLYAWRLTGRPQLLARDHEAILHATDDHVALKRGDTVAVVGPGGDSRTVFQGPHLAGSLSPDGTLLALESTGDPRLHILDTRTGAAQEIELVGWLQSNRWSAHALAYTTRDTSRMRLGVLPNGSTEPIYPEIDGSVVRFSWHPDGRTLAYVAYDQAPPQVLYTVSLDDLTPRPWVHLPGGVGRMAWSPDGETLAVTVYPGGSVFFDMYLLQGEELHWVYRARSSGASPLPFWTPDGEWLLLVDRRRGGRGYLVAVRAADGVVRLPVEDTYEVRWLVDWWTPDA